VPPFLEIDNVVAGYGGGDILRGVDLVVDQGSLTCLVGPNGAGKSTVLKVVSGLLAPKRGDIRFKGRPIGKWAPRAIVDLGIVQVAQDRSLFPAMTVRENVLLGGFALRDHALKAKRLAMLMERFPIVGERARDRAGSLSGGQQKLVEFARALMLEPTLMLVDEPSMGLEPKARRIVFDTLEQLRAEGRTILLVEQNARSGLEIADRGVVLERGRVRLTGSGAAILADEHVGDIYMGKSVRRATRGAAETEADGSAGPDSRVPGRSG
jgi:branched-chain amino acid transport system ATP-binding protein